MKASERLNCSAIENTLLYHCVPNENFSFLVEFCYNAKRIGVLQDNCLKLDDSGTLQPTECKQFKHGCPNKFYFSNTVWQYPECLQINENIRCFRADESCQQSSSLSVTSTGTNEPGYNETTTFLSTFNTTTSFLMVTGDRDDETGGRNEEKLDVWMIVSVLLLLGIASVTFLYTLLRVIHRRKVRCPSGNTYREDADEEYPFLPLIKEEKKFEEDSDKEAFFKAARNGKAEEMEKLLKKSAEKLKNPMEKRKDPTQNLANSRDRIRNYKTALHIASEENYLEATQLLIDYQADVNLTDTEGKTALYNASEANFEDIVKVLLTCNNLRADIPDKIGRTALYQAVIKNHPNIIKLLFEHGANIHYPDKEGLTPLIIAIRNQNIEIVKMFTSGPLNNRGREGGTNLYHAVDSMGQEEKTDDLECVRLLIHHCNADVNICDYQNRSPLLLACKKRRCDVVDLLLKTGKCNTNQGEIKGGWTPLHEATSSGNNAMTTMLLEHGGHPNVKDKGQRTPLHFAAKNGNKILLQNLLDHGANIYDVDIENVSALHFACMNNKNGLDILQYFWTKKYDFVCTLKNSETCKSPIYYAIRENVTELVNFLHAEGFGLPTSDGKSLIHSTAHRRNLDNLKYLVERASVDVNEKDKDGKTPLYILASGADMPLIEYLIEKNADVNLSNHSGRSPLHEAVSGGHFEVVKKLIVHQADVNREDNNGNTPLQESLDKDYQYQDIAIYLKSLSVS
ncbi:serine/threonine-protein phosphatase 6 regulatory ankyrin repeat subunit A-like isoform X4 [Ostrea edulis]|nr:serine/threonine-protein phosphatase 6 regulatory ankyrin repeat subunit A-like isoform X4 [Ostrea edulis]